MQLTWEACRNGTNPVGKETATGKQQKTRNQSERLRRACRLALRPAL